MTHFIRKFTRRSKGLEALQAVLLVGVAFLICTGLSMAWTKSQGKFQENLDNVISTGSSKAAGS